MEKRAITLNIDGQEHTVHVHPAERLLDVLRDTIGLGSVREGCGIGVCGACTVLVDGMPMSSCLLLVGQVEGKRIRTAEGLAPEGTLHPVQRAFIEHNAFQCAYCTPGFVLLAVALIEQEGNPDEKTIQEYIGANLCRCGSYRNILRATQATVEALTRR